MQPLKLISCDFQKARDAMILRAIKTLETINDKAEDEFWEEVKRRWCQKWVAPSSLLVGTGTRSRSGRQPIVRFDPGQIHVRPRRNGGRGGDLGQQVENPAAEEWQREAFGAAAGQDRIVRTALRFPCRDRRLE